MRKVYEDSGLSQREFCKRIGAFTTSLTEQLSGKCEITVRFAQRVEKEFDIGADWLLYGDERNKEFPCGEEMVEYLKGDIEMRKIVWEKMRSQTAEE
ncbi:MAG: helix-turn-helix transcriptional regulator [Ruminococcus sp.]|nr:helix-turn-helix transcriptional regulator [Ruminococcus sp.]